MTKLRREKEQGNSAIEYAIIAALIAVTIITVVAMVGSSLSGVFGNIGSSLTGMSEGGGTTVTAGCGSDGSWGGDLVFAKAQMGGADYYEWYEYPSSGQAAVIDWLNNQGYTVSGQGLQDPRTTGEFAAGDMIDTTFASSGNMTDWFGSCTADGLGDGSGGGGGLHF